MPRGKANPVAGNESAAREVAQHSEVRQWVVVDPLKPATYEQAKKMLKLPSCAGMKIHPEEHRYPIKERGRELFEFVADQGVVVITHSGEENSLPGDYVEFADKYPEVRLILSHMGCGFDGDPTHQVRAIQAGKHDNMFVDTSSAASLTSNMLEWAVKEIGAEKIMYGTDTPLYFSPMQRARIDYADLADGDKQRILRDNAIKLFGWDHSL